MGIVTRKRVLILGAIAGLGAGLWWSDPATYKIAQQVPSPDGKKTALLIVRNSRALHDDTEYYGVVTDMPLKPRSLRLMAHNNPAMVVTAGSLVQLKWSSAGTLDVNCSKCGLSKANVLQESANAKNVEIHYSGFPNGTIEDCSPDSEKAECVPASEVGDK